MSLPRIPPPPRTDSPPTADLISLDTPLPVGSTETPNPHLQLYTGPSADFAQQASLAFDPSPPRPHREHSHPRIYSQPPRRLSQIFSSAGPTSPAVVSEDKGNAGFIIPGSPSSSEEFGGFKSAPVAGGRVEGNGSAGSPPGRQRRMSSLDNLWRGLHLGTGAVGTFPSTEEHKEHPEVFHDDPEETHHTSPKRPSLDPSQGPGWRHTLSSTLGNTLKAKSKWKTVIGPSTFHPDSPGLNTGYALHHDDPTFVAEITPKPTAKPIAITHSSPFAPTPAPTPGSASFRNPFYNPLSGAPGFQAGEPRPRDQAPVSERREEEQRDWRGTRLLGRREGTDVVLDSDAADALRPYLPARQRLARSWTLLFSTDQHGASLSTFYRLIAAHGSKHPEAGNLLVIRDAHGARFGVFMNEAIRKAEGMYTGSGESWLFKLGGEGQNVDARVFKWTGKNHYFALCESDFISFGGGDGRFGLWLDRNFYKGSSARCPAYDNEVLCDPPGSMRESATFECYGLEVWATA